MRTRAGVLALAITASSLDDSEFDAEAWKAQKDEELKFLLKVRELAHEHARVAAGSRFDDDRWGRRWALGEAAYNYGTAHLVGKFSCATSYAEAARTCTDDEATELRIVGDASRTVRHAQLRSTSADSREAAARPRAFRTEGSLHTLAIERRRESSASGARECRAN